MPSPSVLCVTILHACMACLRVLCVSPHAGVLQAQTVSQVLKDHGYFLPAEEISSMLDAAMSATEAHQVHIAAIQAHSQLWQPCGGTHANTEDEHIRT